MIGMPTIPSIRQRLDAGDSVAQVARDEGVSEPTVRKYRDMGDFSLTVKTKKRRASKLDPYKPVIDSWLLQDRKRRARQRHTARRIFDRLTAECGYDGSHATVQRYVKARKAEARRARDGSLHLEWAPAGAQVDFGVRDFRVLGVVREARCLVAAFPFPDASLAQCLWGESPECACEGLAAVFESCGGAPIRLVFDSATGAGRRVGEAIGTTETFERLAAHHGLGLASCDPYSGNERGAAGNAVGAIRRNAFVPMPRIDSLPAYDERLLTTCMRRAGKPHCFEGGLEGRPFGEDRASMPDPPARPFGAARVEGAKTDESGDVCLEGKHRHPLGSAHACERVGMETGASRVALLAARGEGIARFGRAHGGSPTRASDPLSQLALLCRKPGAWRDSEVRATMPSGLAATPGATGKPARRASLRVLRDVSAGCGHEATPKAMEAPADGTGALSEADMALAASCIANGQGAMAYDDEPSLASHDVVLGGGA